MGEPPQTMAQYSFMNIASCEITDKGCSYLSKGEWGDLQNIHLSFCLLIEMKIKSVIRAVKQSAKESGLIYNASG